MLKGIRLFPNPVKHFLQLQYDSETTGTAVVAITDMNGVTLLQKDLSVMTGTNQYKVNTGKWVSGTYFITIRQSGRSATLKFEVRQ